VVTGDQAALTMSMLHLTPITHNIRQSQINHHKASHHKVSLHQCFTLQKSVLI